MQIKNLFWGIHKKVLSSKNYGIVFILEQNSDNNSH